MERIRFSKEDLDLLKLPFSEYSVCKPIIKKVNNVVSSMTVELASKKITPSVFQETIYEIEDKIDDYEYARKNNPITLIAMILSIGMIIVSSLLFFKEIIGFYPFLLYVFQSLISICVLGWLRVMRDTSASIAWMYSMQSVRSSLMMYDVIDKFNLDSNNVVDVLKHSNLEIIKLLKEANNL
jgi:hypothetical protein